jgi:hypothetical protein
LKTEFPGVGINEAQGVLGKGLQEVREGKKEGRNNLWIIDSIMSRGMAEPSESVDNVRNGFPSL